MWKRLNHPNIVPFKGVTLDPLQLISEWMPCGESRDYIKENQGVNHISLVGSFPLASTQRLILFPQLLGIAEGLVYLHSCNVIHGDLKGVRVDIDPDMPPLTGISAAKYRS